VTGGQNGNPGARAAQPGQGNRYAEAAGTSKVTQGKGRAKRSGVYEIHPEGDGEPFTIEAGGREAWALDRLTEAGPRGCTPIAQPAPRWSAYVHRLRALGVPIETRHEPHGGAFAGTHGRYILRARAVKGGAA
jgi:hypothetical protein